MRVPSTFQELRRLEDDLNAGTINRREFRKQRRAIKDAVEVAVAIEQDPNADAPSPHELPSAGRMALLIFALLAAAILLGTWLLRDLLLALTLAVTGLAALTIRAFKGLSD